PSPRSRPHRDLIRLPTSRSAAPCLPRAPCAPTPLDPVPGDDDAAATMAVDSDRGEGDLEIGLASPGSEGGVSPVAPGRRALESFLSGKCLDQSPSRAVRRPALVMSSSGKRLDQSP
uniref:Uncharacterized protein n=2 Tax=Triticinae TaxID=1648030 RepID=A0A453E689_AEGTS